MQPAFQKLVLPEPLIAGLEGLNPGAFAGICSGIIFLDNIDMLRHCISRTLLWLWSIFDKLHRRIKKSSYPPFLFSEPYLRLSPHTAQASYHPLVRAAVIGHGHSFRFADILCFIQHILSHSSQFPDS